MKSLSVDHIRKKVRACLDELGLNDACFMEEDQDSVEFNGVVEYRILEAVKYVHLNASHHLLDGIVLPGSPTISGGVGKMTLPVNFLRLISFRMSDWIRPVCDIITEYDAEYHKQADEYARGTFESPVCALVKTGEGDVLEFYSCKDDKAKIAHALYLPLPVYEDVNHIPHVSICEKLEDAIINQVAGLVLLTYKDQHADSLINLAQSYMT